MEKHTKTTALFAAAAAVIALPAVASAQIADTFEADSSALYTVVNDGTPDGTVDFNFDYVAAGLPLAPNSLPGQGTGLRLTVNDAAAAVDAYTVFNNTPVTGNYRMSVDVFMFFSTDSGSTEHAHVGVGGDGVTFNQLFSPISGSGSYVAFTGDGGSGSDYRWFLDAANNGLTTVPNTDDSYLGHGSNNTGEFYTNLFPSPPATVAASPGNIWTTVEVEVEDGTISYFFDGQLAIQGTYTGALDGLVSLGLADTFTSVNPDGQVYTVFDNLVVTPLTVIPEPASLGLLSVAGLGLLRRRKA